MKNDRKHCISRRTWLRRSAMALSAASALSMKEDANAAEPRAQKARIAITLDLEMSRNFPQWETTHWDYEKGNLNEPTKRYSVEAGKRVREKGGRIHYFCVGRVLEQQDVTWLAQLAKDGHPIGNHTYDHVNILAQRPQDIQFRFRRAPWLIEGKTPAQVIRENIHLTQVAMQKRLQIEHQGFRTPGGFHAGLEGREDVQKLLLDAGFQWASCKYPSHANSQPMQQPSEAVYQSIVDAQARAQPFVYKTGLIEIPMSPISDIGAFRSGRWKLEWFLEAIERSVQWAIDNRAVFDFLGHPSCLYVVDPEFRALDLICKMVADAGDRAEITDLNGIAKSISQAR